MAGPQVGQPFLFHMQTLKERSWGFAHTSRTDTYEIVCDSAFKKQLFNICLEQTGLWKDIKETAFYEDKEGKYYSTLRANLKALVNIKPEDKLIIESMEKIIHSMKYETIPEKDKEKFNRMVEGVKETLTK